jgi:hypothetical protein
LSGPAGYPLVAIFRENARFEERGVSFETEESIGPEGSSVGNRHHGVVIGMDEHEDPACPDAGYAVAETRALAKMLVERFGFARGEVKLPLQEDATRDVLKNALEDHVWDRMRRSGGDPRSFWRGATGRRIRTLPGGGRVRRGSSATSNLVDRLSARRSAAPLDRAWNLRDFSARRASQYTFTSLSLVTPPGFVPKETKTAVRAVFWCIVRLTRI